MVPQGDTPSFIRHYHRRAFDNGGRVVLESRLGTVPVDGRAVCTGAPLGMDPK